MIPKIIHYCWFGKNKKPKLVRDCIKSWEILHPEYKIIEWNEKNFPIDNDFLLHMYKRKKWAFVSDYARLKILYEHGGYYLDTDMFLLKRLDSLKVEENTECILCAEDKNYISFGFIGIIKHFPIIKECIDYYENLINFESIKTIPMVLTSFFKKQYDKEIMFDKTLFFDKVIVFNSDYFYPFPLSDKKNIKSFLEYRKVNTVGIHLWSYSWEDVDEYILIRRKEYSKALKIIIRNLFSFKPRYLKEYLGSLKNYIFKRIKLFKK